jgi:hypothetical protein
MANTTSSVVTPSQALAQAGFPQAGEIWLPIENGDPVIVTGVIHAEDENEELTVCFSNLELENFETNIGYFLESYDRRKRS